MGVVTACYLVAYWIPFVRYGLSNGANMSHRRLHRVPGGKEPEQCPNFKNPTLSRQNTICVGAVRSEGHGLKRQTWGRTGGMPHKVVVLSRPFSVLLRFRDILILLEAPVALFTEPVP